MRYLALASDYDGTLASGGAVTTDVVLALLWLIASGRHLVIVTGRQLEDLLTVFPDAGLSTRIVAENGAVLYSPETRQTEVLGRPPAASLIEELNRRGVRPLSIGRVVVGTERRNERVVAETIASLGLRLRIERNKDALMVLPEGIDKANGLRTILDQLSLTPNDVIGMGDAENDVALLEFCGLGIAVANALDSVKSRADRVTRAANGRGVVEVVEWLLREDR